MSFEARLCREIVEEEFGLFPSAVTYQVLLKGRLSLSDIIQFTKLTQRQVRESLTILIQHGLCHFTEPIQNLTTREPTFYQIDANKVMFRLRMGSILRLTSEHFGAVGVEICTQLFLHGRLTLNGLKDCLITEVDDWKAYVRTFTEMANKRYITAVLPEHSRSALDRLLAAEEKEAENYTITTAKELQAIKRAAFDHIQAQFGGNEMAGMKRKVNDPMDLPSKRFALDDELDNFGNQDKKEELIEVEETVFFGVNYDKYNMIFRNDTIVDFATERVNRTAGQVVRAFFEFGKNDMKSVKENDTPAATPLHIANLLSNELLTRGDIILQQDLIDKNKKPSAQETVRGYITLLKMDQAGFIKNKDERGANQYTVNLSKLRESMKRKLLESLLRERLGVATCRIARILIEKGKLDESQVQKLAMLPPKDTREKLAQLNLHGFVEIQEVPKSADRAPGRSFHLWYVPLEKCYKELLVDVYRVIGNLQQRKKEELSLRARLLEKLNRQDVKENMDLLSDGDKANLANMNKVLQRLETSKNRLDAMVMILRDF
ncbi:unnamed protein product [Absidia cylindrospora]